MIEGLFWVFWLIWDQYLEKTLTFYEINVHLHISHNESWKMFGLVV